MADLPAANVFFDYALSAASPMAVYNFMWEYHYRTNPPSPLDGENLVSTYTQLDNTSELDMAFVGTGISIWVDGQIAQFNPDVDAVPMVRSSSNDQLWEAKGLDWGQHSLHAKSLSNVRVRNFTVHSGMKTNAPSFEEAHKTVYQLADEARTGGRSIIQYDMKEYSGELERETYPWEPQDDNSTSLVQDTLPYYGLRLANWSTFYITPPANTSFFILNGVKEASGSLVVSIDIGHGRYTQQIDCSTEQWALADMRIFMSPLDPEKMYNISFDYIPQDTDPTIWDITLSNITFYSALWGDDWNASTSTSTLTSTAVPTHASAVAETKNNVPAIAGAVVGGVVGIALLAVLIWFLACRGKRQKSAKELKPEMDLNEEDNQPRTLAATVSPFPLGHGPFSTSSASRTSFSYTTATGDSEGITYSRDIKRPIPMAPFAPPKGLQSRQAASNGFSGSFAGPAPPPSHQGSSTSQSSRGVYHEQDVGSLQQIASEHGDEESEPQDVALPPMYNPAWEQSRTQEGSASASTPLLEKGRQP